MRSPTRVKLLARTEVCVFQGIVTCHSFGCSYNMGKGPVEFL